MSFGKIRPTWPFNAVPTSVEFNQLDTNQSRAIDGFAGGAYSPSGPIVIGGQGISLSAGNSVTGSLVFGTGATLAGIGSVLNWAADAHFGYLGAGATTFANGASVSAGTFAFLTGTALTFASGAGASFASGSTLALNGTMTCTGTTTYSGVGPHAAGVSHSTCTSHLDSGASIQADAGSSISCNLGSTLAALGTFQIGAFATATCQAPIVMSGVGRVVKRTITGADADSTYGINDADTIYAVTTAPRTYTISTTGAVAGDVLRIVSGANFLTTVQNTIPATITTVRRGTGLNFACELTFLGGAWVLTGQSAF